MQTIEIYTVIELLVILFKDLKVNDQRLVKR